MTKATELFPRLMIMSQVTFGVNLLVLFQTANQFFQEAKTFSLGGDHKHRAKYAVPCTDQ